LDSCGGGDRFSALEAPRRRRGHSSNPVHRSGAAAAAAPLTGTRSPSTTSSCARARFDLCCARARAVGLGAGNVGAVLASHPISIHEQWGKVGEKDWKKL
jgi:hypothetical protein